MKKLSKLAQIVTLIICFLLVLQIIVANRLNSSGLLLSSLEQKSEDLSLQNDLLARKIATFSSLTQIAGRASELGYVKAKTYYLSPQIPVALGNTNGTAR